MIDLPTLTGETAIYGLGRSGEAAAFALQKAKCDVVVWDDAPEARAKATKQGLTLRDLTQDFTHNGTPPARLVLAPGIAPTHKIARHAHEAGAEIIGDMDLFQMARHHMRDVCVIGITGTNGKSTTTALVAYMLQCAGWQVQVGGNIGTSVLSLANPTPNTKTAYVLELSSYQLALNQQLRCDIGVWLNLSPDHLARHGTMADYAAAKAQLFAAADTMRAAIIGCDDAYGAALADKISSQCALTQLCIEQSGGDFAYDGRWLSYQGKQVLDMTRTHALRGAHNAQNAAAAYSVGLYLDLAPEIISDALSSFQGLAHRLQPIATYKNIAFVNDSKATNIAAARRALAAFHNIYWIAGGRGKGESAAELEDYYRHIARAYLIGEAAQDFSQQLGTDVPHMVADDLTHAVQSAAGDAVASEGEATILLSPACASFDQFADFEARGDAFCTAVASWITAQDANQKAGA